MHVQHDPITGRVVPRLIVSKRASTSWAAHACTCMVSGPQGVANIDANTPTPPRRRAACSWLSAQTVLLVCKPARQTAHLKHRLASHHAAFVCTHRPRPTLQVHAIVSHCGSMSTRAHPHHAVDAPQPRPGVHDAVSCRPRAHCTSWSNESSKTSASPTFQVLVWSPTLIPLPVGTCASRMACVTRAPRIDAGRAHVSRTVD